MDKVSGNTFNIGGGSENSVSLLELIELIGEIHGEKPCFSFKPRRVGDQHYYVTDSAKFRAAAGWRPAVSVRRGVKLLYEWLIANRFKGALGVPEARRQDEIRAYQSAVVLRG